MTKCLEKCTHAHGKQVDGFIQCAAATGHMVQVATAGDCTTYELHYVSPSTQIYSVEQAILRAQDDDMLPHARSNALRKRWGKKNGHLASKTKAKTSAVPQRVRGPLPD